MDIFSIYTRVDRRLLILAATVLIAAIAFTDWFTQPYISIGFLYLVPHHIDQWHSRPLADRVRSSRLRHFAGSIQ